MPSFWNADFFYPISVDDCVQRQPSRRRLHLCRLPRDRTRAREDAFRAWYIVGLRGQLRSRRLCACPPGLRRSCPPRRRLPLHLRPARHGAGRSTPNSSIASVSRSRSSLSRSSGHTAPIAPPRARRILDDVAVLLLDLRWLLPEPAAAGPPDRSRAVPYWQSDRRPPVLGVGGTQAMDATRRSGQSGASCLR